SNPAKQIVLGTALLVGITMVANAEPVPPTGDKSAASGAAVPSGARQLSGNEVSALPPSDAKPTRDSIKLPGVSVVAPYSHTYTSGVGPKVSPNGRVRAEHHQVPPDYVTDIAMHPYASGVGPKAGPNRVLRVAHYEVPPGYDVDVTMHPYTSAIGPSEYGARTRAGDLLTSRSHYNR
ncbi:MAG TPA: hypothetical protein VJ251_01415, partial [Stellaceae bacterium]|nr:hypothetical protein [Stellaceae bacterium]